MSYGVTPQGFVKKRLPEIRQEIIEDLRGRLIAAGKTPDIDTRPDSVIGILVDTFAEREAAKWEIEEGVYYSMYPDSASGTSLDKSVGIVGMERLNNEKSKGYVVFYGAGTIEKGVQLRNKITQDVWQTTEKSVISQTSAADVSISPTVASNHTYAVTISNVTKSFTSSNNASLSSVLAGLISVITAQDLSVSSDGANIRIVSTGQPNISFSVGPNLAFSEIGTRVAVESVEHISRGAEPNEIAQMVTLINGVTKVTNLESAVSGRKTETDAELRRRHQQKNFGFGKATLNSFEVALNSVVGVTAVKSFTNSTNNTDSVGRPPHSVHIVVEGGLPEKIAKTIHETVAAGIDTHGSVTTLIDTEEGKQSISFDRPKYKYIHAKAVITTLSAEEQAFLSGGRELVKKSIAKVGKELEIGTDVVTQRFMGEIYKTPGIANVDLQFSATDRPNDNPISFSNANIEVAPFEKAVFDITRVEVT